MVTAELLRSLPKVQLHCHLEGTLRPASFIDLAHKHGVALTYRPHEPAWAISLVFFGASLALVGYLIARPPVGVLWLAIAFEITGACYIINSFTIFLSPTVHALIFPWILLPPFAGELGLTFWLLFTRRFNGVACVP